jgi:hypothetical protein
MGNVIGLENHPMREQAWRRYASSIASNRVDVRKALRACGCVGHTDASGHFSALMVAMGTSFSSFWILVANSWMQTPAGYEIVNGQFFPKDSVIFSPSIPYRLAHVVVCFFVTTGFVILGVRLPRSASALRGRGRTLLLSFAGQKVR